MFVCYGAPRPASQARVVVTLLCPCVPLQIDEEGYEGVIIPFIDAGTEGGQDLCRRWMRAL